MEKDKYIIPYKLTRMVGKPLFQTMLHPAIIRASVIPKTGPIVLCGNHLHVWDQFPVICATERVTHWMAKKEYFDGKMGPFFRFTGAICTDRQNDPKHAFDEALEYLAAGSAIGLFPEGTRNKYQVAKINAQKAYNSYMALKEQGREDSEVEESYNHYLQLYAMIDQEKATLMERGYTVIEDEDLLPFKFGSVSMAQKANAVIVPFGVTGDYTKDNNNLMVRFGEPFKNQHCDLESSNRQLREQIGQLVKKNRSVTHL